MSEGYDKSTRSRIPWVYNDYLCEYCEKHPYRDDNFCDVYICSWRRRNGYFDKLPKKLLDAGWTSYKTHGDENLVYFYCPHCSKHRWNDTCKEFPCDGRERDSYSRRMFYLEIATGLGYCLLLLIREYFLSTK